MSTAAQLLLEPLRIGSRREQEDDLARRRDARVDESAYAVGDVPGLGAAPMESRARIRGLVGDEELDRRAEDRVAVALGRLERLEIVPERAGEELVHGGEHFWPGAVVERQRQDVRCRVTPVPEYGDVRMTEAVDRLELVTDEEHLLRRPGTDQIDQLRLEAVRVLELVDHDRSEPKLLHLANRLVVTKKIPRAQLQVLEVERRLAILGLGVGAREPGQELLE